MANTLSMKMPDLTPAQIVATIGAIGGELVADTLISNHVEKEITGLASIVVPLIWMIADAIIRHGRSKIAVAQINAASVAASLVPTGPSPPSV